MKPLYPWQQHDWERLQILRKRPPHGLLLKGAQGIGKLDFAVNFAHSLLCQHPTANAQACGSCPACHWLVQGSHPDFRLVQSELLSSDTEESSSDKKPSKQISVAQIRELSDFIGMTSHQGGQRVVIIHPAEMMNVNAANALLKSLEEPPPGLIFILVTDKPQRLLPTILSRCLSVVLSGPDEKNALAWLTEQGIENPVAALATAGFSPLLATQLGNVAEEREILLRAIRQPAHLDIFGVSESLQKIEQVLIVQWLQQWCYDLLSIKLSGRVRYHPDEITVLKKLAEPVAVLSLARMQKHLLNVKREAQHTLNAKLFLESLLLTYRQMLI